MRSRNGRYGNDTGYKSMMLKIIVLFLIFMAVMGMFGKWRTLLGGRSAKKCPKCKGHVVGKSCQCGATR